MRWEHHPRPLQSKMVVKDLKLNDKYTMYMCVCVCIYIYIYRQYIYIYIYIYCMYNTYI